MGNCLSRSQETERPANPNAPNILQNGNKKLVPFSNYSWKSETPMTHEDVQRKRDEFWLTSPSYDGRQEIWQALKAVCETDSLEMAQAIIDSAGISVPTGKLTDGCYDELGNQYVLPSYLFIEPTNLVEVSEITKPLLGANGKANNDTSSSYSSESSQSPNLNNAIQVSSPQTNEEKNKNADTQSPPSSSNQNLTKTDTTMKTSESAGSSTTNLKNHSHIHFIIKGNGIVITHLAEEAKSEEGLATGDNGKILLRLSTNVDIGMIINREDTVKQIEYIIAKHQKFEAHQYNIRIILKGKIIEKHVKLMEAIKSAGTTTNISDMNSTGVIVQAFVSPKA